MPLTSGPPLGALEVPVDKKLELQVIPVILVVLVLQVREVILRIIVYPVILELQVLFIFLVP